MAQTELACKDVVFHFNKKHLEDPAIPMWVLKTKGESYYVNHVDCNMPWSTKETPDNSHTKGSLKVKDCLLVIDDENIVGKRLKPALEKTGDIDYFMKMGVFSTPGLVIDGALISSGQVLSEAKIVEVLEAKK